MSSTSLKARTFESQCLLNMTGGIYSKNNKDNKNFLIFKYLLLSLALLSTFHLFLNLIIKLIRYYYSHFTPAKTDSKKEITQDHKAREPPRSPESKSLHFPTILIDEDLNQGFSNCSSQPISGS